ncbi:MAG: heme-binding domain-containing protein [Bacteroidales bacterium]|nr:heme-binding domain-containing protein [Bacteroidales bacterium]
MKAKGYIFLIPVFILMFASVIGIKPGALNEEFMPNPEENLQIPEDVQTILDKSCFGCHNVDAKSDKAKKKLLLDELPTLSKAKIVAKLDDIHEVLEENEMPPEKFLEKYPDKALTDEEAARLKEWAENAANELMK